MAATFSADPAILAVPLAGLSIWLFVVVLAARFTLRIEILEDQGDA